MIDRLAVPGPVAPATTPESRLASAKGFATNVAYMLTGTVVGQAFSVLLAPMLTRIYLPDQFGYLGVYTATLAIIGVAAALGYELAIPIAPSSEELANLLAVSIGALIGLTLLMALAAFLMPDRTLALLWTGSPATFRILLPVG